MKHGTKQTKYIIQCMSCILCDFSLVSINTNIIKLTYSCTNYSATVVLMFILLYWLWVWVHMGSHCISQWQPCHNKQVTGQTTGSLLQCKWCSCAFFIYCIDCEMILLIIYPKVSGYNKQLARPMPCLGLPLATLLYKMISFNSYCTIAQNFVEASSKIKLK